MDKGVGRCLEGARRPVSRVLSLPCGDGRPFLCDARYRTPDATNPGGEAGMPPAAVLPHPAAPIRSCSRWGLPCRPCRQGRGALLPHRFTLAIGPRADGGLFSVALSLGSPPPAVSRHRIPVEPGLSSITPFGVTAAVQPSGPLVVHQSHWAGKVSQGNSLVRFLWSNAVS